MAAPRARLAIPPTRTLRRVGAASDAAKPGTQHPQPENSDFVRLIHFLPAQSFSLSVCLSASRAKLARLPAGGQPLLPADNHSGSGHPQSARGFFGLKTTFQ